MPRLSPYEKQQVLSACETVYKSYLSSCLALDEAYDCDNLSLRYADFYDQSPKMVWAWSKDFETRQNERIMALLFFIEVNK